MLLVVLVILLLAVAAAATVAWGWFALTVCLALLAVSAVLGTMVAIVNRRGGELARGAGQRNYDRLMGNRR